MQIEVTTDRAALRYLVAADDDNHAEAIAAALREISNRIAMVLQDGDGYGGREELRSMWCAVNELAWTVEDIAQKADQADALANLRRAYEQLSPDADAAAVDRALEFIRGKFGESPATLRCLADVIAGGEVQS